MGAWGGEASGSRRLAPPARFPCDQGRDRRGGGGTWRMAPPRVRRVNAHQTASNRWDRCGASGERAASGVDREGYREGYS